MTHASLKATIFNSTLRPKKKKKKKQCLIGVTLKKKKVWFIVVVFCFFSSGIYSLRPLIKQMNEATTLFFFFIAYLGSGPKTGLVMPIKLFLGL